jgi:hypothetical protein
MQLTDCSSNGLVKSTPNTSYPGLQMPGPEESVPFANAEEQVDVGERITGFRSTVARHIFYKEYRRRLHAIALFAACTFVRMKQTILQFQLSRVENEYA